MEQIALRAFVLLAWPALVVALGLGTVLAVRRLRRPGLRDRASTGAAFAVAAALGLLAAAGAELFAGAAFSFGRAPRVEHFLAALPIALAVGAAVAASSLVGYAAASGATRSAAALGGSLVGPAVLVALVVGLTSVHSDASDRLFRLEEAAGATEVRDRSVGLTVRVVEVEAEFEDTPDRPSVRRLALRVEVRSARRVELETGKSAWPRFTAVQPGALPLSVDAPDAAPDRFEAGSTTTYSVAFDVPPEARSGAGTYAPPTAGQWDLVLDVVDAAGQPLEARASFTVADPSP